MLKGEGGFGASQCKFPSTAFKKNNYPGCKLRIQGYEHQLFNGWGYYYILVNE